MNSHRYSRQLILPEIGEKGQCRLKESRVLCIGVGGLGSPAALYLASAGVGKIGLIDPDTVEISNLQRQILFNTSQRGTLKVHAAEERLTGLNPEIEIETFSESFTDTQAEFILSEFDLVIDGSDNFDTKFLINDACYKADIPMVYGAVDRFEGQLALFHGRRGACYRCLYPSPPKADVRNCSETGVLGAVVGAVGTLQATLALQYLISAQDQAHSLAPKIGELSFLDLRGKWNLRTIQIQKHPQCPTCSRPPSEISLRFTRPICSRDQIIEAHALILQRLSNGPQIVLIDVRNTSEWQSGHISGAIHWPLSRLELGEKPPGLIHPQIAVTYCQSGKRSQRAAVLLIEAGIHSALSLAGGVEAWPEELVQVGE